jgi:nanoRNase/pAp phosphatase (c-di-AMP/oligoRNAs hydrolase)
MQNNPRQTGRAYGSIAKDSLGKTNSMQEQQKQLIAKLKEAQNVLVTVSKNPSVDQLSAAIGFTLALNKLDKHATAVFSGRVPDTIEFLKPEETLEKSTDSLRDFIIALDKSKADKLRYKVEDQVVRIFITPYRTSISEKDLDFSQGDFNVDVVIALGVPEQQDLDEAIQAHGRILHDATVACLSIDGHQELGTLNIADTKASSLSEMVTELIQGMGQDLIDSQIATALLTGIVAMTNRFSNDRTSPKTMSLSSVLMTAGANQQLIATELEAPQAAQPTAVDSDSAMAPQPAKEPGMLEIEHNGATENTPQDSVSPAVQLPEPQPEQIGQSDTPQIHVDEEGRIVTDAGNELPQIGPSRASGEEGLPAEQEVVSRERIMEPPARDSVLSANIEEEALDAPTGELTLPTNNVPMLTHEKEPADSTEPSAQLPDPEPLPPEQLAPQGSTQDQIDTNTETLSQIEKLVDSPHLNAQMQPTESNNVDEARNAVQEAYNSGEAATAPDPIVALNAQPLGSELHEENTQDTPTPQMQYQPAPGFGAGQTQLVDGGIPGNSPGDQTLDMPLPSVPTATPAAGVSPTATTPDNNSSPVPPVPPPPMPTWGS